MASILSLSVSSYLSLPKSQSLARTFQIDFPHSNSAISIAALTNVYHSFQDPDKISDSSFSGKTNSRNPSCCCAPSFERRKMLLSSVGIVARTLCSNSESRIAFATEFTDMPALRGKDYGKTKMRYPDYTETESGLQYKDLRRGNGPKPKMGETVVVDWDGYTIGYYGRIFEARNKTKGGSFEGDDKDFFKFKIGSNEVIPAFEEAVSGMAPGGIRSDAG